MALSLQPRLLVACGRWYGFFQASKGESSGGVVAMIDILIKDLGKELTEVEVDEKNAQARLRENHPTALRSVQR